MPLVEEESSLGSHQFQQKRVDETQWVLRSVARITDKFGFEDVDFEDCHHWSRYLDYEQTNGVVIGAKSWRSNTWTKRDQKKSAQYPV